MRRLGRIVTLLLAGVASLAAGGAAATAAGPGGASPGGGTTTTPAPAGPVPLHLHAATLRQDGAALVLSLETSRPWTPASLGADGQSLCLRLVYEGDGGFASRDVCMVARAGPPQLTYARVLRSGGHGPAHPLPARVRRADERSLVVRFAPAKLKIPYASVHWRALSSTVGCRIADAAACFEALPVDGTELRLRAPHPVGCSVPGASYVTNGPRSRRVVALTFDDGPGPTTGAVLDVLRRERVPATFFLIGQQVSGGAALVQRTLAEGHMVAGHSWNHADLSAGGMLASSQISSTANAIQRASGFRPCLFRAPYGAVSPALIGLARGLGETTVQWDVDTNDWRLPGSGTIAARVLSGVRSGSIVLMHDGGGPRGQTLAALPAIIDGLRSRGYGFVTVTELLGASMRF